MMLRLAAISAVVLLSLSPARIFAQDNKASQPATAGVPRSTAAPSVTGATDSLDLVELQKAAAELSRAVEQVVREATENPELKIAALKVATNAVTAAQIIITQQASTLQAALETLAREVAAAADKQARAKTP